jgi:hypothetical protein
MHANPICIKIRLNIFYIRLVTPGGKMKSTIFILLTICIFTFCVGCSNTQSAATASAIPPTNSPFPPPDTPVPLVDAPTENIIGFPNGKFYNSAFDSYLIINDDDTWRLLEGTNRTFFTGVYQPEGDQVTFADRSGYCSEYENGIYSWEYQEGVLHIRNVQDDCKLRTERITLPYTLQ